MNNNESMNCRDSYNRQNEDSIFARMYHAIWLSTSKNHKKEELNSKNGDKR